MVLAAYALIQAGVWRELDAGYLALNIVGSLLLGLRRSKIAGWDSSCWNSYGLGSGWSGWFGRYGPDAPPEQANGPLL